MRHNAVIEELLHFTCGECFNIWTIATMERYRPYDLFCPHCGVMNSTNYVEVPFKNVVKDTGTVKGRGVFASRAFDEGELVETSPVVVIDGEVPDCVSKYCYDWLGGCALALGQGTLFNHANSSNMRYEAIYADKIIRFYAAHRILKDEELTINYNSNGESEWPDNNYFDYHKIKPI